MMSSQDRDFADYLDSSDRDDTLSGGVRLIPVATPKGTFRAWTKRVGNRPPSKGLLLPGGPHRVAAVAGAGHRSAALTGGIAAEPVVVGLGAGRRPLARGGGQRGPRRGIARDRGGLRHGRTERGRRRQSEQRGGEDDDVA